MTNRSVSTTVLSSFLLTRPCPHNRDLGYPSWALENWGALLFLSLILPDNSCLGDPFIFVARDERRTFLFSPQGQGVERGKDRKHRGFQKIHTPWHGPEDTERVILEQQGRHREGEWAASQGQTLEQTHPASCSVTAHQAGVWLAVPGSVHLAAVACHGRGNFSNSPRRVCAKL